MDDYQRTRDELMRALDRLPSKTFAFVWQVVIPVIAVPTILAAILLFFKAS